MRKFLILSLVLVMIFSLSACGSSSTTNVSATTGPITSGASESSKASTDGPSASPLVGNPNDEYYLFLFVSGVEFWKPCIAGFMDAGADYGVKTVITGTPKYDVNEAITVFEQLVSKKPKGIAVAVINDEAFVDPINKAVAAGIEIVTFNADSPLSNRSSFVGPDNYAQGQLTADEMAKLIGGKGEVAIITVPGQSNHEALSKGYQDRIKEAYPDITCVEVGDSKTDPTVAAATVSAWVQAHPNLKGIYSTDSNGTTGSLAALKETGKAGEIMLIALDRSDETLNSIGDGSLQASVCEGTYNEGFWSMHLLYQAANNLPSSSMPPFVNCGTSIITKDNYTEFYLK